MRGGGGSVTSGDTTTSRTRGGGGGGSGEGGGGVGGYEAAVRAVAGAERRGQQSTKGWQRLQLQQWQPWQLL